MFHRIQGLTEKEAQSANTRVFTGEGTPFLAVPGLLAVKAVRIGTQEIPLAEERDYPKDPQHKKLVTKQEPLIDLQHADDGTPILLRSVLSNDGMWQKGQPVYVTGEWEAEKPAKPAKQSEKQPETGKAGEGTGGEGK